MPLASEIILIALSVVALFIILVAAYNIALTRQTGILYIVPERDFRVTYSAMWIAFIIALILILVA